jgi:opacity protein-like surface antigen
LIARKFGESFSFQLSPSIIHKNLVPTLADKNTSYAVGLGGRLKLTSRMTFNAEYFYYPDDQTTLIQNRYHFIGI